MFLSMSFYQVNTLFINLLDTFIAVYVLTTYN